MPLSPLYKGTIVSVLSPLLSRALHVTCLRIVLGNYQWRSLIFSLPLSRYYVAKVICYTLYLSLENLHNEAWHGHRNGVIPIAFLAIPKCKSCLDLLIHVLITILSLADRKYDSDYAFRKFKRQLYHSLISAILESLHQGMMMLVVHCCPDGHYCHVIYDIGPFITDYPKQVMLASVV